MSPFTKNLPGIKPQNRFYHVESHIDLDATKPVLGVSVKARLKPVSAAKENGRNFENSLLASSDMMLSN